MENLTTVVSKELITPSVITDRVVTEWYIVQEATSYAKNINNKAMQFTDAVSIQWLV